ncbi:outer membrane beta-barrel protein [Massilia glaciei]|uniref:Outer membrane protein beta-barrel domain-containing protein n=1 Tax=Massilia glaciei TaxID=1524097 RepID=A0A2U2I706_9BURK|nr:outer membrane beta-barrel protein [Massilia glaciei]PWF55512.1 hypothetical protein C7C56_001460 [Massilia glaciei]
MKKTAFAAALAIAMLGSAQAQNTNSDVPEKQTRFFLQMGFTGGGDKIATIHYTDGSKGDVTFGSLIQLGAGVDYRINETYSVQASINDHLSSEGADNGSVRFTRFPLEVLGYYKVSPQWRIGAGARFVMGPNLKSRGAASGMGNGDFDNTVGGIVEAEYAFGRNIGLKLRYVAEKYKVSGTSFTSSGNHVGLIGAYYF